MVRVFHAAEGGLDVVLGSIAADNLGIGPVVVVRKQEGFPKQGLLQVLPRPAVETIPQRWHAIALADLHREELFHVAGLEPALHLLAELRGVQVILGKGENAVQIRFNEHELTAAAIETAIRDIRDTLGDEQAAVQILIRGGVSFGDGFALREFAEVAGIELKSGDVFQDADG